MDKSSKDKNITDQYDQRNIYRRIGVVIRKWKKN